ncbi:FtsW/RodA/SpoVE family cell cycle protein [Sutcliffiella horikoshii]|uniref:FtsW/RodA/SpoVE family cell cycle protein n=1 Tax=Sutcliffiella horikoshii TaxID=79883 RepID=UPI00203E7F4B|nr:FtsW/RodA/SpoVE family cell cycle protein [Sutcliffiella horikoshii]MCM3618539.1 FtsW/RodA/SpoVE family cell cycle protein [Sutcliffiella horikoshii]
MPAAHTDLVFPYLVYSLGWAFGIFLSILLLIFIWRMSQTASKTKDYYGKILVVGGATLIAVPAIWNILMGLGFAPIINVSFPFVSYGGSSLLFYSAVLGIILSVYRRKDIVEASEIYS